MAAGPAFAATANLGVVAPANAAMTGTVILPTNAVTLFQSPATRSVSDAVTTAGGNAITSATAAFVQADVGCQIGGVGVVPGTTIIGITSGTSALLSQNMVASGTGITITIFCFGSRIEQIRITQTASSTAVGILNFWTVRGSLYYLLDVFTYAIVALSTTSEAQPVDFYYSELLLRPGDSVAVANTVVNTNGGNWACTAFGGNF